MHDDDDDEDDEFEFIYLPGFKVFDIFNGAVMLAPFRIVPFDTNPYACVILDLISKTNEKWNGKKW